MSVEFTPSDVATYYRARLPQLNQRGPEWRCPCPVHGGKRDSFAVDPKTGRAYCHSECGQGWDILGLEQVLSGGDFKAAKAEVFRIIGRAEEPTAKPKRKIRRVKVKVKRSSLPRGRPVKHSEDWSKITCVLFDRHVVYLDRLSADIRAATRASVSRAEIIRGLIGFLDQSGIDVTAITSEQELTERLLARMKKR